MIGIYLITNIKNNRNYVGKSIDIERRWKEHISELNLNKHINMDLQEDWNTYGEEDFTFKTLEVCSEDILSNRERHWIDIFNAREYGYNFDNRKTSKKKYNKDTKKKENIDKLMKLCNFYKKHDTIGLFYFEDICEYLHMSYRQLFNFLLDIKKKNFEKYNTYIMRNWYFSDEYVAFCDWDANCENETNIEYYEKQDINTYITQIKLGQAS